MELVIEGDIEFAHLHIHTWKAGLFTRSRNDLKLHYGMLHLRVSMVGWLPSEQ